MPLGRFLRNLVVVESPDKYRRPILVHQMGKVGSSSVVRALVKAGFPALQTHVWGTPNLEATLQRYTNSNSNIERFLNERKLFFDQILATKILNEYLAGKHSEKLKVITMAREPVARWRSAIIQNYKFYVDKSRKIHRLLAPHKQNVDQTEIFRDLLSLSCRVLEKAEGGMGSAKFTKWFQQKNLFPLDNTFFRTLLHELLVSCSWFDRNIRKVLGVDILTGEYRGISVVESTACSLLMFKYEELLNDPPKVEAAIREFVNAKKLKLQTINSSKGKEGAGIIRHAFVDIEKDFQNLETMSQSRYCRFFGYNQTGISSK